MILSKTLSTSVSLKKRTAFFRDQPWAEVIMNNMPPGDDFEQRVLIASDRARIGGRNKQLQSLVAARLTKLAINSTIEGVDAFNLSNKEIFKKVMQHGVVQGWYDMRYEHITSMCELVSEDTYPYYIMEEFILSGYAYRMHGCTIELPDHTLIRILYSLARMKSLEGDIEGIRALVDKYKRGVVTTGIQLLDTDIIRHAGKRLIPA